MKYGCIGETLAHSYSAVLHNLIGDYDYQLKEVEPSALTSFFRLRDFCGINVTVPYKEAVLPLLDVVEESALKIGAVNTVINRDGLLYGYNTDFFGLSYLLKKNNISLADKTVLILGSGGTSKTAKEVARKQNAKQILRVSRTGKEDCISYSEAGSLQNVDIIINTTPCGMAPDEGKSPIDLKNFSHLSCVIDVIYHPAETALVKQAHSLGIPAVGGLLMLVAQAVKSYELFFQKKAKDGLIEAVYHHLQSVSITKSVAKGTLSLPPSKSISHRALICAALTEGKSFVAPIDFSSDILATLSCLRAFGADWQKKENGVEIGTVNLHDQPGILNCHESGSTLRMLIPIALLCGREITFTGSRRLFERPLSVYENLCKEKGFLWKKEENRLTVCGRLKAGEFSIPADISSQFVTGLMLALPLLSDTSIIRLTGKVESRPYIELTKDILIESGVRISFEERTITVAGKQKYSLKEKQIEPDLSLASVLDSLNWLGADVKLDNLPKESKQGDGCYPKLFDRISCGFCEIDISNCPDLAPILMVLGALKNGVKLTGAKRLQFKESNRATAMAEELAKCGGEVAVESDTVTVSAKSLHSPTEELNGHNDHRIVMALCVLCSVLGGDISQIGAVDKSVPNFFEMLSKLNIIHRILQ